MGDLAAAFFLFKHFTVTTVVLIWFIRNKKFDQI